MKNEYNRLKRDISYLVFRDVYGTKSRKLAFIWDELSRFDEKIVSNIREDLTEAVTDWIHEECS